MTKSNLNNERTQIVFGDDNIVIQQYIAGIEGGRTLDMTDYTDTTVKAGHVIIVADGVYKPMPVTDGAYGTLPTGASYAGVLRSSILADKPFAAIMTWGRVNSEAVPYAMDTILDAFKTACPYIEFVKDEEA